jgi:hypothetical protein
VMITPMPSSTSKRTVGLSPAASPGMYHLPAPAPMPATMCVSLLATVSVFTSTSKINHEISYRGNGDVPCLVGVAD